MTALTYTPEQALEQIKSQQVVIADLHIQVKNLTEQLAWFQKQVFGQRSEKIKALNEEQLLLPIDLPPVPVKEKKVIPAHERRTKNDNPNKISFPDNLPIERLLLDLKEEEKFCLETGKPLIKIGEDVTQRLAHKPGSYYIKEIIRPKYAAPKCSDEAIFSVSLPDSFLSRCKADESLLADILVKKFADHLPLYRQSEILSREGITISRQLLSQWVIRCGLGLKSLYDEMLKQVLASNNVFIDEVPVDMLKPGKGSVHQAYMWVLVGGEERSPPYRIYNFRTNRSHSNAADLLKGYHGVLHSDKYGAYETLANKKQFIWCPCWSHIRRKFFEAESGDPEFRRIILRKIRYLFMLERIAWNRSEDERLRIRREKELPIINELICLVKDKLINGKILARSQFKEALGYFCGLIPYLKNYIEHPYARLDNNVAERAVRPLAIGRKNWLFLGNEEGGEAAAVIFSLVQTCRSIGVNPREYLEDVMRRIMSHSNQKIEELLPNNWIKAFSQPA